ncbi:hypothetical protein GCM10027168_64180 [Streptomyces capparidis]
MPRAAGAASVRRLGVATALLSPAVSFAWFSGTVRCAVSVIGSVPSRWAPTRSDAARSLRLMAAKDLASRPGPPCRQPYGSLPRRACPNRQEDAPVSVARGAGPGG